MPRPHLLAFSRWMCGFGQITDFGPDEARAAYFAGQADVEIAGAQRLVAATLAPASAPGETSTGQPA